MPCNVIHLHMARMLFRSMRTERTRPIFKGLRRFAGLYRALQGNLMAETRGRFSNSYRFGV
jgi:hypothetical protein